MLMSCMGAWALCAIPRAVPISNRHGLLSSLRRAEILCGSLFVSFSASPLCPRACYICQNRSLHHTETVCREAWIWTHFRGGRLIEECRLILSILTDKSAVLVMLIDTDAFSSSCGYGCLQSSF